MIRKTLIAALLAVFGAQASAAVDVNSTSFTYNQNFDSLATCGTGWVNDSTLAGWSLFNATGAAITTIPQANGSTNAGSFNSFGTTGATDRALGATASGGTYFGSPASGALAGYIVAAFTNVSGSNINSASINFNGEQWRNGGNTTAQSMVIQYGIGASYSAVTTWNNSFSWTSPVATATAAAVDGNVAGLVSNVGGTIATPTWTDGSTLFVRWIENNDVGNDHGLAIDNFSLSVTAVPEPESYAMLLAGLGMIGLIASRRGSR
jgi:hypothetical protein